LALGEDLHCAVTGERELRIVVLPAPLLDQETISHDAGAGDVLQGVDVAVIGVDVFEFRLPYGAPCLHLSKR
jgi:hypothetical protein